MSDEKKYLGPAAMRHVLPKLAAEQIEEAMIKELTAMLINAYEADR